MSDVHVVLVEIVLDEVAADAEVTADGLTDAQSVQRARQGISDGVGDGAVVLVALVERRHVVEAALQDGPGQQLDPLGHDGAQVGVDHHQRLHLERLGDLEDGAQGRTLAAHTVDLGIGERQALQPVARSYQQDALDVVGRLGLDHDTAGAVGRAGVGIDQHRLAVGEVLHQPGLRGARDMAYGGGVLEAGDADHDVGGAKSLDLCGQRFGEGSIRHALRLAQWRRAGSVVAPRAFRGASRAPPRAPHRRPTGGGPGAPRFAIRWCRRWGGSGCWRP